MGQLERYGLFIMVLLIFMIGGFAVWGEPVKDANARGMGGQGEPSIGSLNNLDMLPPAPVTERSGRNRPVGGGVGLSPIEQVRSQLDDGSSRMGLDDISLPPAPGLEMNPGSQTAPVEFKTYVIKKGDILGTIAKDQLGRASYYSLIASANPGLDPNNLKVGTEIKIPVLKGSSSSVKLAGSPFSSPVTYQGKRYVGVAYRVNAGESMALISRKKFAHERYTHIIAGINPGVVPEKLTPGDIIRIPTPEELSR